MDIYARSDREVLRQLGERLRQARLRRNVSQQELADRAGLNRTTVSEYERGASTSTLTLVQVLRALELLEELDAFLPDPGPGPLELARRAGHVRQRAGGRRGGSDDDDDDTPSHENPSW